MKKVFKWSVLLTFILAIIWLFIMPTSLQQSPIIRIIAFGDEISAMDSISRFWDLTIIIGTVPIMYLLSKKDDGFNSGIIIISIVSVIPLTFYFESPKMWMIPYVIAVFAIMAFIAAIEDLPNKGWIWFLVQRLWVSMLAVILANGLIFGLLNGILMAKIFLLVYLSIGILIILGIGLYKFITKTPKNLKLFIRWMNKD